jgi:RNA polymerase sigma-70 factor, ECF subfamily
MSRPRRLLSDDPLSDPEPLIARVYAYVAYRVGPGPEAEDVTSEAFARAVRYKHTYKSSKASPVAWMIGIARRCADDALAQPTSDHHPPEQAAPGDLQEETVTRLTLVAAVRELGERDRQLIALRYGADLSARQIAAQLDMTTNAVEVALHRALGRLRTVLGEETPSSEPREERANPQPMSP